MQYPAIGTIGGHGKQRAVIKSATKPCRPIEVIAGQSQWSLWGIRTIGVNVKIQVIQVCIARAIRVNGEHRAAASSTAEICRPIQGAA